MTYLKSFAVSTEVVLEGYFAINTRHFLRIALYRLFCDGFIALHIALAG
jgi:hypothetical protein